MVLLAIIVICVTVTGLYRSVMAHRLQQLYVEEELRSDTISATPDTAFVSSDGQKDVDIHSAGDTASRAKSKRVTRRVKKKLVKTATAPIPVRDPKEETIN